MNKTGPSGILTNNAVIDWAKVAPIVKAVDNPHILAAAHDSAIRIHRHYFHDFPTSEDAVRRILDSLEGYRHRYLVCELLVGIGREDITRYIAFIQNATAALHKQGLLVAGPGWYSGSYNYDDWKAFRAVGWCGLDFISLQAYWANHGFTPWNALRFVEYWQSGDLPILITECGRDTIRDNPDGSMDGAGGWKKDSISEETYIQEVISYDAKISTIPYVLGASLFTGSPTDAWSAYDTDTLSARLAALTIPRSDTPIKAGNMWPFPYKVYDTPNMGPEDKEHVTCGFIHYTASGVSKYTLEQEFIHTLGYMRQWGTVSADALVGPGSVAFFGEPFINNKVRWTQGYMNKYAFGIEIVRPDTKHPYTDFQYKAAAVIARRYCEYYDIPIRRIMDENGHGLIGHQDSKQGKASKKTDPGGDFNWDNFIDLCLLNDPFGGEEVTMKWRLGFATFVAALKTIGINAGTPVFEPEEYVKGVSGFEVAHQESNTGTMMWIKAQNDMFWIGKDRVLVAYNGGNLRKVG